MCLLYLVCVPPKLTISALDGQLIGMEDDCTWNSRRTVALPSSPIRSVVDVKGNQVFLVGPSSGGSAKAIYSIMLAVREYLATLGN